MGVESKVCSKIDESMKLSVIICTFMRAESLILILDSIDKQNRLPDEVIIVDSSFNDSCKRLVENSNYSFVYRYNLVGEECRGLTLQRNFGISKVDSSMDLVSFLDDDLVLKADYFEKIVSTFQRYESAIGVGGIDLVENSFFETAKKLPSFFYYELDGWVIKESLRNQIRKLFGLITNLQPFVVPPFGHGRSVLPPNGKVYPVEHFMGGIATYRPSLFKEISFSEYFRGYGLYEDFDFCVRSLNYGELYINTAAQVWHYHDQSGRPNFFKYGKMVVRNGWFVWKGRFSYITPLNIFKWHMTTLLLANLRLVNSILGPDRKKSFLDYSGRMVGWVSLFFNSPKFEK